jgi:hypothetical protein
MRAAVATRAGDVELRIPKHDPEWGMLLWLAGVPRLPDRIDHDRPVGELAGHSFALPRPAVRSPAVTMASCRNAGSWASGPPTPRNQATTVVLPAPDTSLVELVALAKARWRIEDDCRGLKTGVGLDHLAHPRPSAAPRQPETQAPPGKRSSMGTMPWHAAPLICATSGSASFGPTTYVDTSACRSPSMSNPRRPWNPAPVFGSISPWSMRRARPRVVHSISLFGPRITCTPACAGLLAFEQSIARAGPAPTTVTATAATALKTTLRRTPITSPRLGHMLQPLLVPGQRPRGQVWWKHDEGVNRLRSRVVAWQSRAGAPVVQTASVVPRRVGGCRANQKCQATTGTTVAQEPEPGPHSGKQLEEPDTHGRPPAWLLVGYSGVTVSSFVPDSAEVAHEALFAPTRTAVDQHGQPIAAMHRIDPIWRHITIRGWSLPIWLRIGIRGWQVLEAS